MLRYCTACQKEYDFSPREVSAPKDLHCPVCGNVIPKNSRRPDQGKEASESEEKIGRTFSAVFHIFYVFYITLAIIGIVGMVLGFETVLYVTAVISLIAYSLQFFSGATSFPSGAIILPVAAVIGFLIFHTFAGICLAVHIVFLVRHLIRDVFYRLIFWLIRKISQ